jgi:hypothetical protein
MNKIHGYHKIMRIPAPAVFKGSKNCGVHLNCQCPKKRRLQGIKGRGVSYVGM